MFLHIVVCFQLGDFLTCVKMCLGLVVWWTVTLMGVVGGARLMGQPVRTGTAPQPHTSPHHVPTFTVPSGATHETQKDTSRAMRSTKDTLDIEEQKAKVELIHSEVSS